MALSTSTSIHCSKRLFLAIELPDFIRHHCRERITQQLQPLDQPEVAVTNGNRKNATTASVNWILDDSTYHCTLQFLGSVDTSILPDLTLALGEMCRHISPFELSLDNSKIGCFPHFDSTKNARVLCFGFHIDSNNNNDTNTLTKLSRSVMDTTEPFGFPREKRPFHAHVTLGRVKPMRNGQSRPMKLNPSLKQFIDEQIEIAGTNTKLQPFPVRHVSLIESISSQQGPSYKTIERFDLCTEP